MFGRNFRGRRSTSEKTAVTRLGQDVDRHSFQDWQKVRAKFSTETRAPKMSVSRRTFFPFDGECDLSRDADLTITFSEGEHLRAHSEHLKQASSVLKTALEDCKHDGTLDVRDDSRKAWLLLLNLVHPGRRITRPSSREQAVMEEMVRFISQESQLY